MNNEGYLKQIIKEAVVEALNESTNNTHPKYVSGYKLTPEGYKYCKKLFSKLLAKDQKDYNTIKTQKQAAGISESGDVGFVKQNANLFRISSSDNESVGTRRKYCFALKIDRGPYLSMADSGALGFKGNSEYYLYTYTTKKKLKVATAYYIIDHYDMSDELRYKWNLYKDLDLWSNYFRLGNLYRNKDNCANDNLRELYVYLYRVKLDINKYLYRSLFKKDKNKTLQAYIDKGFDAIIDPEDWVGGFAYPLIILNPEDSLEISKVEIIKVRSR